MIADKLRSIAAGAWKWIALAASLIAGALLFLYRLTDARREAAEERAQRAKASAEAQRGARETERRVDRARDEARDAAEDRQRDLDRARARWDRPSEFGDPRLRRGSQDSDRGPE